MTQPTSPDPIEEAIRLLTYELGAVKCAGLSRDVRGVRVSIESREGTWIPLADMLRKLRELTK